MVDGLIGKGMGLFWKNHGIFIDTNGINNGIYKIGMLVGFSFGIIKHGWNIPEPDGGFE